MDNNLNESTTIITTSPKMLKTKIERKGVLRFFEVMITLCIISIAVLSVFIAYPLPKELVDKKITFFFVMELLSFFPFITLFGIILTITGQNQKSNSDLIIRLLTFMGSFTLLGNVIIIFLLRNIG